MKPKYAAALTALIATSASAISDSHLSSYQDENYAFAQETDEAISRAAEICSPLGIIESKDSGDRYYIRCESPNVAINVQKELWDEALERAISDGAKDAYSCGNGVVIYSKGMWEDATTYQLHMPCDEHHQQPVDYSYSNKRDDDRREDQQPQTVRYIQIGGNSYHEHCRKDEYGRYDDDECEDRHYRDDDDKDKEIDKDKARKIAKGVAAVVIGAAFISEFSEN